MFIPYLRQSCLVFFLSVCSFVVQADVYKWVDEDGQVHYSQQAPVEQQAEMIKAPPPPAIDAGTAQWKLDNLINEQKKQQYQRNVEKNMKNYHSSQKEQRQENCKKSKYNLQQYQNNPAKRVLGSDGNVTRPTEEQRQQKIQQLQQDVNQYCQ